MFFPERGYGLFKLLAVWLLRRFAFPSPKPEAHCTSTRSGAMVTAWSR